MINYDFQTFFSKSLDICYSVPLFPSTESVMKLLVVGLALLVGGAWAQHSCKFFVNRLITACKYTK